MPAKGDIKIKLVLALGALDDALGRRQPLVLAVALTGTITPALALLHAFLTDPASGPPPFSWLTWLSTVYIVSSVRFLLFATKWCQVSVWWS